MTLAVVDARTRTPIQEDYLVYLPGWSLERYLREAPENAFWEFVHGEVVVHSPVRIEHQRLVFFLGRVLAGYLEHVFPGAEVVLGPAGLRVAPEVIREPDIFVLAPEDADKARGFPVEARPLLVVEVVSPSTRRLDLEVKPQEYARAGIPEYWVVDEEHQQVLRHELVGQSYHREVVPQGRVLGRSVPGFWLDVAWLWSSPRPGVEDVLSRILQEAGDT